MPRIAAFKSLQQLKLKKQTRVKFYYQVVFSEG